MFAIGRSDGRQIETLLLTSGLIDSVKPLNLIAEGGMRRLGRLARAFAISSSLERLVLGRHNGAEKLRHSCRQRRIARW